MLSMIVKHLLSNEYGPWDRIIEFGVFGLILYEVIVNFVRHRRKTKRQKHLAGIVAELARFMDKGQQLQRQVPAYFASSRPQESYKWIIAVNEWSLGTETYLAKHSGRASLSFSLMRILGIFPLLCSLSGEENERYIADRIGMTRIGLCSENGTEDYRTI